MGVLTSGPRDMPERQRTLKNTLDWELHLVVPGRAGAYSPASAYSPGRSACPPPRRSTAMLTLPARRTRPELVIDILNSLVGSSLVQPETSGDEPRFGLLETIREYALGHLRNGGAWEEAHDRHAAYFAALAKPAESELRGDGQLAWLNRLETEVGNLAPPCPG